MYNLQSIFITYIIIVNAFAYVMMWWDKYQSKRKGPRISENTLFLMAFVFGSVGIYLGMKAPIYHKAAKPKFKWGIPFLFILNVVCVYAFSRLRSN